jgi:hypothetical protein
VSSTVSFAGLAVYLFFTGFGLPLGVPPLPEDPVICRAAPEECLAYASWAGSAAPSPKSANQIEQLLAEPEVQQLLTSIDAAVTKALNRNTGGSRNADQARDFYSVGKAALLHPGALYLSKLEVGSPPVDARGGVVLALGDKAAAVAEILQRFEDRLPAGVVEKANAGAGLFHRIKLEGAPLISWGLHGNYLIAALGSDELESLLRRIKSDSPAWHKEIRKSLSVPRESTMLYANVRQVVQKISAAGGEDFRRVSKALGLDQVKHVASVTGLDDTTCVARTLIAMDGPREGIFRLAAAMPLTPADLAPIPQDATFALAARFNAAEALDLFLSRLDAFGPEAREEVEIGIARMGKRLDLDLREDLLKPLGDVWCLYNSPEEGGLLVTGLTLVVRVKDSDRLARSMDRLVALLRAELSRDAKRTRGPRLVESKFAGKVIYHLEGLERDLPCSPAWCLAGDELIVATFPQQVKARLGCRSGRPSLAAVPAVAAALKEGGVVGLGYCDTRKVAEFCYPLLCAGGTMIAAELRREGIDFDASLIPSSQAIYPHLQPGIFVVGNSSAGVELRSSGLGGGLNGSALMPLVLFGVRLQRYEAAPRRMEVDQAPARSVERREPPRKMP